MTTVTLTRKPEEFSTRQRHALERIDHCMLLLNLMAADLQKDGELSLDDMAALKAIEEVLDQ